jgi:hypothetical protein
MEIAIRLGLWRDARDETNAAELLEIIDLLTSCTPPDQLVLRQNLIPTPDASYGVI